jgi:Protein of unknown function (DUF2934)
MQGKVCTMWLIHQFDSLIHLGECKEYPHMAKTKGPGSRSKKNGVEVPTNPIVSAAPEVTVSAPRTETEIRPEIKEPKKLTAEVRRNVVPINLDEEIRRRAYELYEQRGRMPGYENDDWLVAEREILTRYSVPRQHTA